jgi:multidrug efflux system membrane fusion protein
VAQPFQKETHMKKRNKFMTKTINPSALTLLCAALALVGCGKPEARPPEISLVRTAVVEAADKIRANGEASYLASVRFDQETDLSFKVGGILVGIGPAPGKDWDEGTPVKAGTVLAELKQADFTNALNSARAKAELASKTVERFRKLRDTDAISQQELDVTEADWRTAQAQLDQAEQNLRDSRLVATKDGVVLARYVNSHVTAGQGQRVLRFADISLMSVELGLPDRLIGRFTPGKEVDVAVSALEGMPPFKGRVSEVGVAASTEGRLFRVVIKVPNPDGLLRSGMTARIRVGDSAVAKPGTVCIPLSALVTFVSDANASVASQSQLGVFVVHEGKAVKRAVQTGDILNSSILITEGLRAGEQVVTAGASFLYDGAPVEIATDSLTAK